MPEGESDENRYVMRRGKRTPAFNFSGALKNLPLLYQHLKDLYQCTTPRNMPDFSTLLKTAPDTHGIVDISHYDQPSYTKKIYGFQEFRVFARDNVFKRPGESGKVARFHSVFITKLKSDRAKKKSKPGSKDYFEFTCSIR